MIVSYFGSGCFRLQSGEKSLLIDPINNRLKGDIVLKTLVPADWLPEAGEIGFPGEYEIKEISVRGWPVSAESTEKFLKTIYAVDFEEIRFVFLGHLSKIISDEEIVEELTEPDVLLIPAGGDHFMKAEEAAKLVKKLEPSAVIPSFCKSPNEFLKALGQKAEALDKFVFKKKDLADLKGRIIVLNVYS